nr:hypothetical protein StreXyl84_70140 [Streptomyces sp. Xyl84]
MFPAAPPALPALPPDLPSARSAALRRGPKPVEPSALQRLRPGRPARRRAENLMADAVERILVAG